MSKYTARDKVEKSLGRTLTADEVAILDGLIASVSDYINSYTNREWYDIPSDSVDPTPQPKRLILDSFGERELSLPQSVKVGSITKIEILAEDNDSAYTTWTDMTQVITYPLNNDYAEGIAIRGMRFPHRSASVAITGIWGDGPVPEAIISIATQMVANNLLSSSLDNAVANENGGMKKESIEGYSYERMTGADITRSASNFGGSMNDFISVLDGYKKILL